MRVRDATESDLRRVVEVHEAAVRDVVERSPPADQPEGDETSTGTHYERRQVTGWQRDRDPGDYPLGDDDRPTVVAVRNGSVVGFGGLDVPDREVWAVYVHPDHAGTGVGTALLGHLEGRAVRRGVDALELLATLNAVEFYEAAGYEVVEETVVEREGEADQPVVRMAKRVRNSRADA